MTKNQLLFYGILAGFALGIIITSAIPEHGEKAAGVMYIHDASGTYYSCDGRIGDNVLQCSDTLTVVGQEEE